MKDFAQINSPLVYEMMFPLDEMFLLDDKMNVILREFRNVKNKR